jgi:hypothetical protein
VVYPLQPMAWNGGAPGVRGEHDRKPPISKHWLGLSVPILPLPLRIPPFICVRPTDDQMDMSEPKWRGNAPMQNTAR